MQNKQISKACKCGVTTKPFDKEIISDAWQKNNINYFEYFCKCGRKHVIKL